MRMKATERRITIGRKATLLMCFLLLTVLLSGCSENKSTADTNSPIPGKTAPALSNENAEIEETEMDHVENNTDQNQQQQVIYLWDEGNVPTTIEYTENNSGYFDPPDFRPNMVYFPAKQGVEVKGAVLICAGGAFQFRSDKIEGTPVAEHLSELGYQSFVVNYRLRPFTLQEGALDLARAVRHVRSRAENYGIDQNDIAVMGFSAGGIIAGELLLNFDGFVDGNAIDPSYVPDELDKISADASAVGMIYSFYGRLSVASTDVEKFKTSDLPPAYFLYGTRDPFVSQFEACVDALQQANVTVESHALQDWPHGFGAADGNWILDFDKWLTGIFEK